MVGCGFDVVDGMHGGNLERCRGDSIPTIVSDININLYNGMLRPENLGYKHKYMSPLRVIWLVGCGFDILGGVHGGQGRSIPRANFLIYSIVCQRGCCRPYV